MTFKGKVHILTGKVLDGIAQPDLTSVKLKLVSVNDRVDPRISCLNYSTPLIEISVGEIPEDRECAEDCVVKFWSLITKYFVGPHLERLANWCDIPS